jgi:DNA-binding NarL/FixJ family response regulator
VRVLVVNDQLFVAQALAIALGSMDGIAARACLADPQLAVEEARTWPADVAIVVVPEGQSVARAFRCAVEGVRVLGLARDSDFASSSRLQEMGFAGVVPFSADIAGIVTAVKAVVSGYLVLPQPAAGGEQARLHRGLRTDQLLQPGGLTRKGREIIGLAVQGLTDADIARVLGISLSRVRAELKAARARTGSRTRMQLVGMTIRQGGVR